MNSKLFVYGTAVAAFAPAIVMLVTKLGGIELLHGAIVSTILFKIVAVGFALHAVKATELETLHKVLWTIGMIAFPTFLLPAYWYQKIRPDLAYTKYADLSDSLGEA